MKQRLLCCWSVLSLRLRLRLSNLHRAGIQRAVVHHHLREKIQFKGSHDGRVCSVPLLVLPQFSTYGMSRSDDNLLVYSLVSFGSWCSETNKNLEKCLPKTNQLPHKPRPRRLHTEKKKKKIQGQNRRRENRSLRFDWWLGVNVGLPAALGPEVEARGHVRSHN